MGARRSFNHVGLPIGAPIGRVAWKRRLSRVRLDGVPWLQDACAPVGAQVKRA